MTSDNTTLPPTRRVRRRTETPNATPRTSCELCGGKLEPIANRRFLLYKRAQLPQPHADAIMCNACGAVYNDIVFEAALQARAAQLVGDN